MKVNEIIQSSLATLEEKKDSSKAMHQIFKSASDQCGLEPKVLNRVKDYNYYKGLGWESDPLTLDPSVKFKDRVSPVFRNIDDLCQTKQTELLDDYIEAIGNLGIKLDFSNYVSDSVTTNKEASDVAIQAGTKLQKSICKLADQIRDEDSVDAESQGFGPQKEYVKLINLAYSKNRRGKDIEDRCQEALLNLTTAINSYEQVNNNSY